MGSGALSLLPLFIVLLIVGAVIWAIIRSRKNEKIVVDEDGNEVRTGLGGWLILVGLGVVFSPLRLLAEVPKTFLPIFNDGTYDVLTTPGTDAYHPFWSTYIWGEIFFNTVIFIASIYLAYLYFSKKTLFPKFYIWLAIGSLAFIIIDAMLIKVVLPNEVIFDPETMKEVARSGIVVLVWVPYMLLSKRVKATFVN
jgi:magnesium-transporting ATPase (P-type)